MADGSRIGRGLAITFGVLVLVAIGIRATGLSQGLPYILHPDEPFNLNHSADMILDRTANPHFFNYPSLMLYAVAMWQRAALALGLVHRIDRVDILTHGTADAPQRVLVEGARWISVVCGVVFCVAVAWTAARVTRSRGMGVLALAVAAVAPLAVRYSRFIAPDIYAAMFYAIAVAACVAIVRQPRTRTYVVAGVAIGLGTGSKYTALAAAVPLVAAHVVIDWRSAWSRVRPLLAAGASLLIVFVLTTPYALFSPREVWDGVRFESTHYATGHPGYEGQSLRYYFAHLGSDWGWVLVLLAVYGTVRLAMRQRADAIVLVAAIVPYFLYIARQYVHFERNVVIVVGPLIVLAVAGVADLVRVVATRLDTSDGVKWGLVAVLVGAITVLPAISTVREARAVGDYALEAARAHIARAVPAGSRVVIEENDPWIDPERFDVLVAGSLANHPPSWYRAKGVDYLVASSDSYQRYFDESHKYPRVAKGYQELFDAFCEVWRDSSGGHVIRVLAVSAQRCPAR